MVEERLSFYSNVTALKAISDSGGDIHEYALDAMLDALQFTVKEEDIEEKLLWPGTQMIVLTDAPSKNKDLKYNVTEMTQQESIYIHFFVSYHPLLDGVYQEIADKTEGTLVNLNSNFTYSTFIASYKNRKCEIFIKEPQKQAAPMCTSFLVSQLASLFKFSGKAIDIIILTSPSGKSVNITSMGGVALHTEPIPEFGEWQACTKSGIIEVSAAVDIQIDATIIYLEGSSRTVCPHLNVSSLIFHVIIILLSTVTGSSGTVVLLTSKASQYDTLNLNLLGPKRNLLHTIPLSGCGLMFSGNTTFPSETYIYQISGTDSLGIPILINLRKRVTFKKSEYAFKIEDLNSLLELKAQEVANVSVSIHNENHFSSTFKISAHIRD